MSEQDEINQRAWEASMRGPEVSDDDLLRFLTTNAQDLPASSLSPSAANLIDDICANGERKLTHGERRQAIGLYKDWKEISRRDRRRYE